MSEGMQIAALHHTKMAQEYATLWVAVSSTTECVLRRSPNEALRVEVVDELGNEFRRQEERCSCVERPGVRICDLILGPPSSWAWLADRWEVVVEWLRAKQAT
jgi:hypothetical protein